MKKIGTVTAVLLLMSTALGQAVKNPGTLVSLTISDWSSFDPAQCYDTACSEVVQNTMETLYLPSQAPIESAGTAKISNVPLLATALPTITNGGKTFTIHIQPNAKFSDGTPVTSADVKYDFMRLMLESVDGSAAALILEPIMGSAAPIAKTDTTAYDKMDKAIGTPNATTLVFNLAKPFAPFTAVLAHTAASVYSKAAAIKAGAWDGGKNTWQKYSNQVIGDSPFLNTTPLGSAPFVLSRYDKAQQVILRRNDKYWRAPAKLQTVVIKVVNEPSTAVQLMKTGDADQTIVASYPRNVQSQFQALSGTKFIDNIPTLTLSAMFMNFNIQDPTKLGGGTLSEKGIPANFFSDKNVRLGFAHSFDYAGYVRQQLLGKGIINNTAIHSALPGYNPSLRYGFDKTRAASDFKKAWGGKLWNTGFTVSIYWNSGNTNRQKAAQLMKANVESLNPKFHINVQEAQFSQILADGAAGRESVWMLGWAADYGDSHNFAQPFLASDGNYPKQVSYKNATVDKLINQAVAESNPAKRAALYRQIGQLGFNDVAEIPLYQTVAYSVQQNWVKGRTYSPLNPGDYYYTTSK